MEADIGQMVESTGLAVPLAAQLFKVIADSGASQLEITVALGMVGSLRVLLPAKGVPEFALPSRQASP